MPRQKKETSAAVLGFEDKLWQAAVLMRGKLPATQYRQVLMGLLFLRYVSDAFEKRYGELKAEGYGDEEDRDAYLEKNIFFVPKDARWERIAAVAHKPENGQTIDAAMQAIARVNRVYRDKEGGLVVDYIGIAAALKDAMNQYTVRDRKRYGNPDVAKVAKPKFYEHLEVCRAQLHGCDYAKGIDGTDLERAKVIMGAVNFLLRPELKERKEVFLENAYLVKQALSLCAALLPERDRFEAGFMEAVRGMINQWTMSGQGGVKKGLAELNEQISELVKQSVASEGVLNIFSDRHAAVSLFDAAFLAEVGKMKEKNLAIEMLKRLLEENIQRHTRTNLVKSEEFSDLLKAVMNEYLNGHISNEEVIKRLIELAKHIKEDVEARPKNLTEEELAFYDALSKPDAVKKFYKDETLVELTKELTDQLRRNRTVDWNQRASSRAHMRRLVKLLLRKYKYPPDEAEDALQTVIRQCELWVDETPMDVGA